MLQKSKILFIPAWRPCSFFEEQQQVYAEKYEIANLIGCIQHVSWKNILSHLWNDTLRVIHQDSLQAELHITWINLKRQHSLDEQFERYVKQVGDYIVKWLGEKPAVVHIQSISDIAIFVAYWAKQNNIPVVLTEHILYIRHQNDYLTKKKEAVYSIADRVDCVSNYLLRNLLTNGFKMQQTRVIGNLINIQHPVILPLSQRNGRIMFVASHLADKNIPLLLEVAEELVRHNIHIDIFGLCGSEHFSIKRTLAEEIDFRMLTNTHLKGSYKHNDLIKQYAHYSVLLSTSISETFGLAVAEAIACGVPVVCTDSGGIHEFVNEHNGTIVASRQPQALVEALIGTLQAHFDVELMSKEILLKYGYENYKIRVLNDSNKKRLSIIIPYFNAEKYIERCIRSVCEQDIPTDEYEVIAISDASEDNSISILQSLQVKYSNLRLLRLPTNLRQGGARNVALEYANGEWIWFVDADDYIMPDSLSLLLSHCKDDVDILHFNYHIVSDTTKQISDSQIIPIIEKECSGVDFMVSDDTRWWLNCVNVWQRITKRDFLLKNSLRFAVGVQYEDVDYSLRCFAYAHRVRHINFTPYNYCLNAYSTTQVPLTRQKIDDYVSLLQRCESIRKQNKFQSIANILNSYMRYLVGEIMFGAARLSLSQNKSFLQHLSYSLVINSLNYLSTHQYLLFISFSKGLMTDSQVLANNAWGG